MGCNCGGGQNKGVEYEVRKANGEVNTYTTKPDAQVAAARFGGTIKEVAKK